MAYCKKDALVLTEVNTKHRFPFHSSGAFGRKNRHTLLVKDSTHQNPRYLLILQLEPGSFDLQVTFNMPLTSPVLST